MGNSIAIINKDAICTRLANGEYMKDIAADLKISPASISFQLSQDKEYLAAREAGLEHRLDKASSLLESVTMRENIEEGQELRLLNLARLYEIGCKSVQWRASVEFPNRWGNKPLAIQINNNTTTSEAMESDARSLVAKIKPST